MTDATAYRTAPWLDDGDLRLYHGDSLGAEYLTIAARRTRQLSLLA